MLTINSCSFLHLPPSLPPSLLLLLISILITIWISQYNLTSLATVATAAANSTEGMKLLAELAVGNKTVLAPNNEAFALVDSATASNASLLATILEYHVINASISASQVANYPNHTLTRTLYNSGGLPGNKTSPVVWTNNASASANSSSKSNATGTGIYILEANKTVSVLAGPITYQNLKVFVIDSVLNLPPTLSQAATAFLPSLAGLIQNAGLLEPLEKAKGVTVFAPTDAAIAAIQSTLATLNETTVATVLGNHVIVGDAAYSPTLEAGNFVSYSGEKFSFSRNATGLYVTSGSSTAKIIQSDIITANGVVHIIDSVLANTANNSEAASSAASSYSAAATATTGAAGGVAIGAATSAGASGSASGTASGNNAAATSTSAAITDYKVSSTAVGSLLAIFASFVGGALLL